jgi:ABC-type transport system substrate-binding protein
VLVLTGRSLRSARPARHRPRRACAATRTLGSPIERLLLGLIAQAPYTEADEFIFNFFDSKSTNGNEKLSDPALDAMVDKERTIVNEDDRLKACSDIQRYLADKMYGVSTVGTYNWAFVSPRVQNYHWTSSGGRPMETYTKLWIKG